MKQQPRSSGEREKHSTEVWKEPPPPYHVQSKKVVLPMGRELLKDREGLRRALLVSEVVSKPRALHPYTGPYFS